MRGIENPDIWTDNWENTKGLRPNKKLILGRYQIPMMHIQNAKLLGIRLQAEKNKE